MAHAMYFYMYSTHFALVASTTAIVRFKNSAIQRFTYPKIAGEFALKNENIVGNLRWGFDGRAPQKQLEKSARETRATPDRSIHART